MNELRDQGLEAGEEASLERTLFVVNRLIEQVESRLEATEAKGTLADYIKLLQIQKDLGDKRVRRIEVKWVDDE